MRTCAECWAEGGGTVDGYRALLASRPFCAHKAPKAARRVVGASGTETPAHEPPAPADAPRVLVPASLPFVDDRPPIAPAPVKDPSKPRFVSWFAGVCGFDLAFEAAGWESAGECDINKFARAHFLAREGREMRFRDIGDVRPQDVEGGPDTCWCAGFPCQDMSTATMGKRKGWKGERSVLVFRLLELAAERRPEWLLLENVPGLLTIRGGADFGVLLAALDDIGYHVAWRVLDSRGFGVPQRRRRVFLACRLGDGSGPRSVLFEAGLDPKAPREAREEEEAPDAGAAGGPEGGGGARAYAFDAYWITNPGDSAHYALNGAVPCLLTGGFAYVAGYGIGQADPARAAVRKLMPEETEYMQGFPRGWTAGVPGGTDRKRWFATGNAVCVPVIEWMARRMRAEVEKTREAKRLEAVFRG